MRVKRADEAVCDRNYGVYLAHGQKNKLSAVTVRASSCEDFDSMLE